MILVQKVIKENGELVVTRKQEFTVKDHSELEKVREKLMKHYDKKVYFIFKEMDEELELYENIDEVI
jgi:hypothetical protein